MSFLSTYRPFYKNNFMLAYPVMVSQVAHTLVAVADTLLAGRIGTISMAAVSLGNSIFTVFLLIGIGVSYGLTPLVAQENGRGAYQECGRLLSQSIIINTVVGLLLFMTIYIGLPFIKYLNQPPIVVEQAIPFLFMLGLSSIPLMIFQAFRQFAEGLGFTKQAMFINLSGNVLNVLLGIALVFGFLGFKPLGVLGIGIATFVDRLLMAISMGYFVFTSVRFKEYLRSFKIRKPNFPLCKKILGIGVPVALQYIFESGAFSASLLMIGWMGVFEMAAHQIAITIATTTYMAATGIAAAATINTANYFGSGNFKKLRLSAISCYHLIIIIMGFFSLVLLCFHNLLPYLFIDDPKTIQIAAGLIILAACFQLFDGMQVVGQGILRGLTDVKIPTLITMVAYWIIALPLGYILGFKLNLGVQGIWLGLLIGLLIANVLFLIRVNSVSKKLIKGKENHLPV